MSVSERETFPAGYLAYGGLVLNYRTQHAACKNCGKPFEGTRSQKDCDSCRSPELTKQRMREYSRKWHKRRRANVA